MGEAEAKKRGQWLSPFLSRGGRIGKRAFGDTGIGIDDAEAWEADEAAGSDYIFMRFRQMP